MYQTGDLTPLHQFVLDPERVAHIGWHVLRPLQQQPDLSGQYGDDVIQAQQRILSRQFSQTATELGQVLTHIMNRMQQGKAVMQPKRHTRWQSWLGLDIEQQAQQDAICYDIESDIKQAQLLNRQVNRQQQQLDNQVAELNRLRLEMAYYIRAAEQFLHEQHHHASQPWHERIARRIHTLMTAQTAHDLGMPQLQLTREVNRSIMERFQETVTVLIPAWQQHIAGQSNQNTPHQLEQLNQARHRLLQTLQKNR